MIQEALEISISLNWNHILHNVNKGKLASDKACCILIVRRSRFHMTPRRKKGKSHGKSYLRNDNVTGWVYQRSWWQRGRAVP